MREHVVNSLEPINTPRDRSLQLGVHTRIRGA